MSNKASLACIYEGKAQLSALEFEESHTIANVRIHVERVIGIVRQKYSILQGTLPIDYVIKRVDEDYPLIDRISEYVLLCVIFITQSYHLIDIVAKTLLL